MVCPVNKSEKLSNICISYHLCGLPVNATVQIVGAINGGVIRIFFTEYQMMAKIMSKFPILNS